MLWGLFSLVRVMMNRSCFMLILKCSLYLVLKLSGGLAMLRSASFRILKFLHLKKMVIFKDQ